MPSIGMASSRTWLNRSTIEPWRQASSPSSRSAWSRLKVPCKQRAVSHVGARGFTQVMPRTAKWLRPGTRADDLYDRDINLGLGFRYLNQLIDKYSGDVKLALLAYNRGPGTVDKILKRGGDPDNGYARKVIDG